MAAQKTINTKTLLKSIESSCFVIGPTVTAYFITNFTVDAYGYYYRDMEGGIAFGVFLIALGFAFRNWSREE